MSTAPVPVAADASPRDRFAAALRRQPLHGLVPHFELVFFLTMEAFGRVHPSQRSYGQWGQMEERERQLHRRDQADLYVRTAERYGHSAIFLHPNPATLEETMMLIDQVRALSGERYFLMLHGDATYGIPNGAGMSAFAEALVDDPQKLLDEAQRRVDGALERGAKLRRHGGLDGFALCSDYCFNTGPFMRPEQFRRFVAPYLRDLIQGYKAQGHLVIKHTDGNIMPILDELLWGEPHALHSLDPQGGVDIAELKRRVGQRVCLIGNVNCGLLDTGTDEECLESVRYCLRHGMPGGGYIFSTSNCIYTGMRLARYELILAEWRRLGHYP